MIKTMDISVSMAIQSHLNDALIEMHCEPERAHYRIKFAQWLIFQEFPKGTRFPAEWYDTQWNELFKHEAEICNG
jgi:hypothetical protein